MARPKTSKETANKQQRERRRLNGNKTTKKYEKTINGFLMRAYRNIQSRVSGVQKLKAHLYLGLPLMNRELFYKWSKEDIAFINLFETWTKSNYDRKKTPSVDRIDSTKGYLEGNIRWITHSENSRLGSQSRFLLPISISA